MSSKKSPCVNVCKFSGLNGWCLGCGRTKKECRNWKKIKKYERKILKKTLRKRMLIIGSL